MKDFRKYYKIINYAAILTTVSISFFQLNGEKLLFAVLDGSTIPMTSVKNDELSAMLRWTKQEVSALCSTVLYCTVPHFSLLFLISSQSSVISHIIILFSC